ncbi:MAG TPA: hypothetical protein VMF90_04505 [Rhizobiaceae bacterium]|nr:hypothetical protein [Rhizobiaceae bacterium]
MSEATHSTVAASAETGQADAILKKIAILAFCSIALGFAIQGLILAAKLAAANEIVWAKAVVDMTGGITWALLVCTGVGIGTSIMKARPLLAGVIALICAPIAIAFAKSSQKVMSGLMGAAEQEAVLSLGTISVLRAIEYGVLGWLLGRLAQAGVERSWPYVRVGMGIGVVFGGAIAALTYQVAVTQGLQPGGVQIASSIINEVIFPIGCAFVIYVGQLVGRTAGVLAK